MALDARASREMRDVQEELDALAHLVGHDLRAPIRAIEVLAGFTLKDYGDRLDDEGRARLASLVESSKRAARIVEDVLAFSRASRAEIAPEQVDVSAIAVDVARALRERDPARDAKVVVQPELVAHADPRLARVVVEGLMSNAWKFTRAKPGAQIHVGVEAPGFFFVRDDGVGFDPREAHRLFRPFQRLHPAHEFEGAGLGLATVARAVARHGGAVSAEGAPGRGATFRFRF